MEELKCFINTDATEIVGKLPGFKYIYEYVDEPKYTYFEYDRREWGRIYLDGNNFITIYAQSDVK